MSDMDAYRDVFLAESGDYLQQITDGLLTLEDNPTDSEPVEVVFRGAHSLKGMAAAMGYERTADLTHKMESLMDRVRKGERTVESGLIDTMLAAVDLVRDLIDDESNGHSEVDSSAMMATLVSMAEQPTQSAQPSQAPAPNPHDGPDFNLAEGQRLFRIRITLDVGCVLKAVRGYMVLKRLSHIGRIVETVPSARDIEDERFDREFTVVLATVAEQEVINDAVMHVSEVDSAEIEELISDQPESGSGEPELLPRARRKKLPKLSETQTVRVAIGHLDTLVELVGELVILRSRLERIAGNHVDPELKETVEDMYSISSELQYEVMQTRMVPVGNIFNRFPRMVRDLAADLDKQVDFSIEGLDIELDRTVLDEISDPIVHLLRNSIDHGIEARDVRVAAGKPERGAVRLSAERERDHVSIIVSDDGKGIDLNRVWNKACQLGLAQEEERGNTSDADILLFTCVPGFTTATSTTKVSGRGVGMDVVKGKIEHLGGTLRIDSVPGVGTDFILQLPLTLAIVKALLVVAGDQTFALPLSAVNEVFATEEVSVDTIDGVHVVVLRDGSIAPLHSLDSILFGTTAVSPPPPRSIIVLVVAGGERHALLVDSLGGRREIVIKPLSHLLRDSRGFSGATILGDGRVMLILDPRTIFSLKGGLQ